MKSRKTMSKTSDFKHTTVLLKETVDSLRIEESSEKEKIYFDCTGGGGGHSAEILSRLSDPDRLVIIDRDPDAIEALSERFSGDGRVSIVKANFAEIASVAEKLGIEKADGIIADLGVSSFQLDKAERGFSYMNDAPLDMRMSKEGLSAFDIVNGFSEKELADIIFRFGEEKFSRQIASAIVSAREKKAIESTLELAELVKEAFPLSVRRKSRHHLAKKTFQAIRIAANDELGSLQKALDDMFFLLKVGGRNSIITFHSLEDRIVKQSFASRTVGCTCPKDFPICICGKTPSGRVEKFIRPSAAEIEENPRSRSATLRTVVKLK